MTSEEKTALHWCIHMSAFTTAFGKQQLVDLGMQDSLYRRIRRAGLAHPSPDAFQVARTVYESAREFRVERERSTQPTLRIPMMRIALLTYACDQKEGGHEHDRDRTVLSVDVVEGVLRVERELDGPLAWS